jgi:hypothetical protein
MVLRGDTTRARSPAHVDSCSFAHPRIGRRLTIIRGTPGGMETCTEVYGRRIPQLQLVIHVLSRSLSKGPRIHMPIVEKEEPNKL